MYIENVYFSLKKKQFFSFLDFQIILMQNAKGWPLPTALVM